MWLTPGNDGISNNLDNCPLTSNPSQQDSDDNGVGDACNVFLNDGLFIGSSTVSNGSAPLPDNSFSIASDLDSLLPDAGVFVSTGQQNTKRDRTVSESGFDTLEEGRTSDISANMGYDQWINSGLLIGISGGLNDYQEMFRDSTDQTNGDSPSILAYSSSSFPKNIDLNA